MTSGGPAEVGERCAMAQKLPRQSAEPTLGGWMPRIAPARTGADAYVFMGGGGVPLPTSCPVGSGVLIGLAQAATHALGALQQDDPAEEQKDRESKSKKQTGADMAPQVCKKDKRRVHDFPTSI